MYNGNNHTILFQDLLGWKQDQILAAAGDKKLYVNLFINFVDDGIGLGIVSNYYVTVRNEVRWSGTSLEDAISQYNTVNCS
jgi:hypothetical protein